MDRPHPFQNQQSASLAKVFAYGDCERTIVNRPLRIALFTFSYAPVLTGIATGVHTRVRCLLERGHHVFLIHPEIDGQYPDEVRLRRMPGVEAFRDCPRFSSRAYPTRPHLLARTHPEP